MSMSLTNLKLSDFKYITKLLTRKESLLGEIATIDQELSQFDTDQARGAISNGRSTTGRRGRPPGSGRKTIRSGGPKRARRGQMKEQIVALLKEAGKQGLHVRDIVKKTGTKDPSVRVWFYATGKKIKNIKQVAPATYAWID